MVAIGLIRRLTGRYGLVPFHVNFEVIEHTLELVSCVDGALLIEVDVPTVALDGSKCDYMVREM